MISGRVLSEFRDTLSEFRDRRVFGRVNYQHFGTLYQNFGTLYQHYGTDCITQIWLFLANPTHHRLFTFTLDLLSRFPFYFETLVFLSDL